MGKNQYKTPRLKTVNLELRDFEYYVNEKFKEDRIDFDFNFEFKLKTQKKFEIFIHLQFAYESEEKLDDDNMFPLYHSDHIIEIDFKKSPKPKNSFEVELLAHLLGTSIILVKGYYDTITRGYFINKVPLPVFNPTELIKAKYFDLIEDKYVNFSSAL